MKRMPVIRCRNISLPRKVHQSSPNSENKCGLARPLTMPNFVIWQEMCEICTVENLCSSKSGPRKLTKIDDLLCKNAPHHGKFHCTQPNDVRDIANLFTPFCILALRVIPGPKFTSLSPNVQQAPSIKMPNFIPLWKFLYEISAAKFGWFRWQHDPQKHPKNSKQYSLHITMWWQINCWLGCKL